MQKQGTWRTVLAVLFLNIFGLGAGYLLLGRWRRALALVCVHGISLLVLFASSLMSLWMVSLYVTLSLAVFVLIVVDSWRMALCGAIMTGAFYQRRIFYVLAFFLNFGLGLLVQYAVDGSNLNYTFSIPSSNSVPTLMVGDYVLTSKDFGDKGLQSGDLVIYKHPKGFLSVGRIIGREREIFQLVNGLPHIDGKPFTHKKIGEISVDRSFSGTAMAFFEERTLNGKSYQIGLLGATPEWRDETVPITIPDGHVVILGDNRRDSYDSRFKEVGPIPVTSILRKVEMIYWSQDWSRIGQFVK